MPRDTATAGELHEGGEGDRGSGESRPVRVAVVPGGLTGAFVLLVLALGVLGVGGGGGERLLAGRRGPKGVSGRLSYTVALAFDSTGRTLAAANTDGTVRLWSVRDGQVRETLPWKDGRFLAFAPDGHTLAMVDHSALVCLVDVDQRQVCARLECPSQVRSLAFAPDGKTLAVATAEGRVTVFDPKTQNLLGGFDAHRGKTGFLAFSPDGSTLATGGEDGLIKLWDPNTRTLKRVLAGHDQFVTWLAYSPDGSLLASAAYLDPAARIWNAATGARRGALAGHLHGVSALAFSPDGRTLATAGGDSVVKLWDPATSRERTSLRGHVGWLRAVAFSPDGSVLASGGADRQIRLWRLRRGQADPAAYVGLIGCEATD